MIAVFVFIILAVLEIWISHAIATNKDQYAICLVLGLILGPLGWLIAALLPNKTKVYTPEFNYRTIRPDFVECPHCGKGLRKNSLRPKGNICQWCGGEFDMDIN